jgi:hypothetical protein
VAIGDFHFRLSLSKVGALQDGATLRKEGQMNQLREALEDCNVSDLDFIGSKYTWNNGKQDDGFMRKD